MIDGVEEIVVQDASVLADLKSALSSESDTDVIQHTVQAGHMDFAPGDRILSDVANPAVATPIRVQKHGWQPPPLSRVGQLLRT